MSKKIQSIFLIFIVMNLVGIGVALFLECGLGADSIGLLCEGIQKATGISYGNASLVYNVIIIVIALIVARSNLGLGTVVYALLAGYFIDFYCYIFSPIGFIDQNMIVRFLGFATGQVFLSLALAILIQLNLGMNALDALLHKLEEKTNMSYPLMRTIVDATYVIIGFLLGGTFGIGTIISVSITGFMIGKWKQLLVKIQNNKNYEIHTSK
ncbi:MAG: YczE/YyaS/YitT family protein [Coprobacillaceae bacterium]